MNEQVLLLAIQMMTVQRPHEIFPAQPMTMLSNPRSGVPAVFNDRRLWGNCRQNNSAPQETPCRPWRAHRLPHALAHITAIYNAKKNPVASTVSTRSDSQLRPFLTLDHPLLSRGHCFQPLPSPPPVIIVPHQKLLKSREFPSHGEKWTDIMADVESLIMPGITHWQHPRYAWLIAICVTSATRSILPQGLYPLVMGRNRSVQ